MDTNLKKDIFLLILFAVFGESDSGINKQNCISFFHILVDTLQSNIFLIPQDNRNDLILCDSVLDLLFNFDLLGDTIDEWKPELTIEFIKDFSGLSDSEFDESIYKLRKIYSFVKMDFILS